LDVKACRDLVREHSGEHFDPEVLDALDKAWEKVVQTYTQEVDVA